MLETLRLSSLANYLDEILPPEWVDFEVETIMVELQVPMTELLADKISVIQAFRKRPELFYQDPLFFLFACEVFNDEPADFGYLPTPTSLEAALAIVEASKLSGFKELDETHKFEDGVREVVKHILIEDGYSYPVWPFTTVGITGLTKGAWTTDMTNKEKAIKEYINGHSS